MTASPRSGHDDVPIACSLEAGAQRERLDEWRAFVTSSVLALEAEATEVRMTLDASDATLLTAASLGRREKQCCAFFDIGIALGPDHPVLTLRVPADAEAALATFVDSLRG
jgi:hypothetical protein